MHPSPSVKALMRRWMRLIRRSGTGTNCVWYTRQDANTCLATSHLPISERSCLLHCFALKVMLLRRCS